MCVLQKHLAISVLSLGGAGWAEGDRAFASALRVQLWLQVAEAESPCPRRPGHWLRTLKTLGRETAPSDPGAPADPFVSLS